MATTIFRAVLLLLLGGAASASLAAEDDLRSIVKQLSAQVAQLQQQAQAANARIHELEAKLNQDATAPPHPSAAAGSPVAAAEPKREAKPAVTLGDSPGTFKIPGTDTSVGIGGFVKVDAIYSSISAGSDRLGDQYLIASQIPIGSGRHGEHDQTIIHAKDTRFWLTSLTPSPWGNINTYLELDLRGADATFNYTPRLRHAYGSLGPFLAGQTWTTFLNTQAIPDTLDANGPFGDVLHLRQPMIRWTQPFHLGSAALEWQLAAESPRTRLWNASGSGGFFTANAERYPDLVARLGYNPSWGALSLSAMGRQIRYTRPVSTDRQERWGGAVSLAGRINTFGLDNIRFMLGYGDVYARYAAADTFEDGVLDPSGRLRLVTAYSGMLAYQHWWNKAWRSTLAYGFVGADQPSLVHGDLTRQAQSAHLNLLWSPTLQTTFGLEYTYGLRDRIDGRSGDLHRVQFSTRFNF